MSMNNVVSCVTSCLPPVTVVGLPGLAEGVVLLGEHGRRAWGDCRLRGVQVCHGGASTQVERRRLHMEGVKKILRG